MGVFWLYTLARFVVFAVLYLILWLVGLGGFLGAIVAVALSIPVSYVALARPRAMFAQVIEQRVEAAKARRQHLDQRLSGDE